MITTAVTAKLLRLSERQVQHLAANDQIPGAKKSGRDWQFPRKPQVLRPKRGRPVKGISIRGEEDTGQEKGEAC